MPVHSFICGCPRSGTTMLAQLLNAHEDVVFGIERYATRPAKQRLTPDLFAKERFYSIEPGDTFYDSLDFTAVYEEKRARFDQARVVGDKIPLLSEHLDDIKREFPDPKIIFCLRNIVEVAASYEVRAHNPDDATWASTRDAALAITQWNNGLAAYLGHRRDMDIFLFDYDRFLDAGRQQIGALLEWLDLDWTDRLARKLRGSQEWGRRLEAARTSSLGGAILQRISLDADFRQYRRALRHSSVRDVAD